MFLRGIDFGYCWDQSGVRGFFGEGYPYHRYLKPFGLRFGGSTFVARTTTLDRCVGNMALQADGITPAEFMPNCIVADIPGGYAVNAVGLSGPGAEFLLGQKRWQALTEPFFISFASVAPTKQERLAELEQFVTLLRRHLPHFHTQFGLQIQFSGPHTEADWANGLMLTEATQALDIASRLGVPLVPKIGVETPIETALAISRHPECDALSLSNTVKWGKLSDRINWRGLFEKSGVSPLKHLGGGGLSGKPLFPVVCDWLTRARQAGLRKPLNVGGGVLGPKDAQRLVELQASAVAVGSVAFLRPHRVQRTIRRVNELARIGQFYEPVH
jgi:dihydroorotate dehydrogenase